MFAAVLHFTEVRHRSNEGLDVTPAHWAFVLVCVPNLVGEVLLRSVQARLRQDVVWVLLAIGERVAASHFVSTLHRDITRRRHVVALRLASALRHDPYAMTTSRVLLNLCDRALNIRKRGCARELLRQVDELLEPRERVRGARTFRTDDTAFMEGVHRELCSRLTESMRSDDADVGARSVQLAVLVQAVALGAHAVTLMALQR